MIANYKIAASKRCPRCKGWGKMFSVAGDEVASTYNPPKEGPCSSCNGTGLK